MLRIIINILLFSQSKRDMNKIPLLFLLFNLISINAMAQKVGVVNGFDGGMMLHAGFVKGAFPQADHTVSGIPIGIGGVIRVHLGKHWRVGSEGYVSTVKQYSNGSYVKYGWGGLLCDYYWQAGHFIPYAGITIGGGVNTNLLMKGDVHDWVPVDNAYFNRQAFLAVDPFIGCDYVVSDAFHLTLKADWLNCLNRQYKIPSGPRLYIGFIFYH